VTNGTDGDSAKLGGFRSLCAHPAFPAFVAAWFAALLAGGLLALPDDLIARLFRVAGLDSLIPAGADRLGFSARATLAIAAALAGIALGLSLARQVIRSTGAETQSRAQIAPPYRPLDVTEDLGEEGIAEAFQTEPRNEDGPLDPEAEPANDQPIEPTPSTRRDARESLEELGLMQLTARLGASLSEHRIRRSAQKPRMPTPPCASERPQTIEPSDAGEAARAIADFFAPESSKIEVSEDRRPPTAATDLHAMRGTMARPSSDA